MTRYASIRLKIIYTLYTGKGEVTAEIIKRDTALKQGVSYLNYVRKSISHFRQGWAS